MINSTVPSLQMILYYIHRAFLGKVILFLCVRGKYFQKQIWHYVMHPKLSQPPGFWEGMSLERGSLPHLDPRLAQVGQ